MNQELEGVDPVAEEELDEVTEAFAEYLPGMEVGETRSVGVEEFRNHMHVIHADFNMAKDNSGTIEGDTGTYEYRREADESEVSVTRTA